MKDLNLTGWGKNDIKELYKECVIEILTSNIKLNIMGLQIKIQEQQIEKLKISDLEKGTIFRIGDDLGIRIKENIYSDDDKVLAIGINSDYGYWCEDFKVDEVLTKGTILEIV